MESIKYLKNYTTHLIRRTKKAKPYESKVKILWQNLRKTSGKNTFPDLLSQNPKSDRSSSNALNKYLVNLAKDL